MPRQWHAVKRRARCRARPRWGRSATTFRPPMRSNYQPANITFDLLPQLDEATRHRLRRDKHARHAEVCRRALAAADAHLHAYV